MRASLSGCIDKGWEVEDLREMLGMKELCLFEMGGELVFGLFALQETIFEGDSPSVSGEGTGGTDDAVTGDEEGDRVGGDCASDGANGLGALDMSGNTPVGDGMAVGDAEEGLPDGDLERCAVEANRNGGVTEDGPLREWRLGGLKNREAAPGSEPVQLGDGTGAEGEPFEARLAQSDPCGFHWGDDREGRDGGFRAGMGRKCRGSGRNL